MVPSPFLIPAAAILFGGGLVACFAGYRLFRIVLSIYGFILGALVATSIAGTSNNATLLMAGLGGGLAGALILNLAYFLGVVLVGAAIGAMIVTAIWGRTGSDPHVVVVMLFAVAGAVAAMVAQRYVIITGTAFGGAWTAIVGGLALMGDRAAAAAATANNVWVVYPLDPAPGRQWVMLLWLGLGLAGLVVQLAGGGGGRSKARSRRK